MVKCFDVVSSVVEEATRQFSPLWKLDDEKYTILEGYCGVIDVVSKEFEAISYDVSIDEIKMTVSIVLECPDLVIQKRDHEFYKLARRAQRMNFSVSEDGNLNIEFIFPSLWDKA